MDSDLQHYLKARYYLLGYSDMAKTKYPGNIAVAHFFKVFF